METVFLITFYALIASGLGHIYLHGVMEVRHGRAVEIPPCIFGGIFIALGVMGILGFQNIQGVAVAGLIMGILGFAGGFTNVGTSDHPRVISLFICGDVLCMITFGLAVFS